MSEPVGTPRGAAPRRAVVIGGGMAGMLAAAALSAHAEVTVVERDALPGGPEPRKGLPQARHVHVIWSGGVRAMEELLPGVTDAWLAGGARRISLPTGLVSMQPRGWFRRWPEMQFMIACSRDLLDWVVRERVVKDPRVTVVQRAELLSLEGDADRVTGVRVRATDGEERVLPADLVVDAAGRGSRAQRWLGELGVADAPMEEVDSGLAYSSRLYRAPAGTEEFPLVNVQSDATVPVPGRTTTIEPVEGGRWLVTLSGTRGGEPPATAEEFERFARGCVRHPVVGELIAHAEPLSEPVLTRSTINRRRYYEKVTGWPEGFVAIGDSVATYNPVYGHGLSVAAQGVLALREEVARAGLTAPGLSRRVQRGVARPVATAWELATSTDIHYPGAIGEAPGPGNRLLGAYVNRLMLTATGRPLVAKAFFDVVTLSKPVSELLRPAVLLAVLRGPRREPLAEPPLTEAEWEAVRAARPPRDPGEG
ncbi:NAD(P)/FAD-dependent oxidoreductase [Streptomyces griseoaurantiacus]|uniref:2-polyprenyl-6-methoxyphenol hydroxylase n=1 Tax=Streptomyces griseoaurantiacus TaxID=68213 RepID=A0A1G7IKH3_9ACTN|nr:MULTISPECIES: FAD-dependent monooxygenase [Streptomyces]MDX3359451.1 FAD-dependent monooxygenase [Streptomyces sp. ME02-6978.2a]SDF13105.1 2-polyprenyl-6-methoxyphenol hydroxylase [Streptomyces jietaisiensis]